MGVGGSQWRGISQTLVLMEKFSSYRSGLCEDVLAAQVSTGKRGRHSHQEVEHSDDSSFD